jgi:hypothetical protein
MFTIARDPHPANTAGVLCQASLMGGLGMGIGYMAGKAVYLLKIVAKEGNPLAATLAGATYFALDKLLMGLIQVHNTKLSTIAFLALYIACQALAITAAVFAYVTFNAYSFNATVMPALITGLVFGLVFFASPYFSSSRI